MPAPSPASGFVPAASSISPFSLMTPCATAVPLIRRLAAHLGGVHACRRSRLSSPTAMTDPLLRPFLDAWDEAGAKRELNSLIAQHALPLAEAIVAKKIGSWRQPRAADQEDVISEAMATLIERLQSARAGKERAPIAHFESYAAALIHSACAHYLRRRYPERTRLKNRLRYLLSTDSRLALWTDEDGDSVCGLAEWKGLPSRSIEHAASASTKLGRGELTTSVIDMLSSAAGPIAFESLVDALVRAGGILEPRGSDAAAIASPALALESLLDQKRYIARVWNEIGSLPPHQRTALLLNLRDDSGASLLWLMPVSGVATLRQLAKVLDIPDAEFAALWRELPLDDATIARRLDCTRQQVINLRRAARKRLTNRVRPQGNIGRSSASSKGGQ